MTINLQIQLQRLPAHDRVLAGVNELCFSILVSAAMDGPGTAADVRNHLLPWAWTFDPVVQFAGIDAAGLPHYFTGIRDPSVNPSVVGANPGNWQQALEARVGALINASGDSLAVNPFVWDPKSTTIVTYSGQQGTNSNAAPGPDQAKWHLELMHQATAPAPLPHALQLAHFIFVKQPDIPAGADSLVVSPVISFPGGPKRTPSTTPGDILISAMGGDPVRWKYNAAAGEPDVFTYANTVSPTAGHFTSQWLPVFVQGEDWMSSLESRAADLFDLSRHLIEYMNSGQSLGPDPIALWRFTIATLRDLAQTGASCGDRVLPGKATLNGQPPHLQTEPGLAGEILRALQQSDNTITVAEADTFLGNLQNAERSVSWGSWKQLIQFPDDAPSSQELADKTFLGPLEQKHSSIARQDGLQPLIVQQWQMADSGTGFLTASRLTILSQTVLPNFALRKNLSLMQLGVKWNSIIDLSADPTMTFPGSSLDPGANPPKWQVRLAQNLWETLKQYVTDRASNGNLGFAGYRPSVNDTVLVLDPGVVTNFTEWLKPRVANFVGEVILSGAQSLDEMTASPQPGGLVFSLGADNNIFDNATDESDQRNRAGAVVILRSVKTINGVRTGGEPCCLNLADLYAGPFTDASPLAFPLDRFTARASLVPSRLAVKNNLVQRTVVYENGPVTAMSPAAWLAQKHALTGGAASSNPIPEMLRKKNAYGPRKDPAGKPLPSFFLPALRFGSEYDVAAFNVGLAGDLPSEARATASPADLVDPITILPPTSAWTPLTYNRRVPVGQLRVAESLNTDDFQKSAPLALPSIPATVHPLARSLQALVAEGTGAGDPVSALAQATTELDKTLILLVPRGLGTPAAQEKLTGKIYAPTVDFAVWDRSFDFAGGDPRRAAVLAAVATISDETNSSANPSLDDPAVGGICASLDVVFPAPVNGQPQFLPYGAKLGSSPLDNERYAPIQMEISSTASGGGAIPVLDTSTGIIRVSVPAGFVCSLTLTAMVSDARFLEFNKAVRAMYDGATTSSAGVEFHPTSERHFLIEVATDTMASSDTLNAALKPFDGATDAQLGSDKVGAKLTSAGVTEQSSLYWLNRVTLLYQRWRWNGRPLNSVDATFQNDFFDAATGTADQQAMLVNFDGLLFGDRPTEDATTVDTVVDFLSDGIGSFPDQSVFRLDLGGDPSAIYFRFAVIGHSRYEGLLKEDNSKDSRDASASKGAEAWQRLVRLCRFDKELPPPRVKLLFPLTDALPTADKAQLPVAGVLIVLAEPFLLYGGLAETLTAEAAIATEPDNNALAHHFPSRRVEFGSDPIVRGTGSAIVPPGDEVGVDPSFNAVPMQPLSLIGPIGYTFDTNTLAPEFVYTSFILDPPAVHPADEDYRRGLAWYFLKVQLRRGLVKKGHFAPPANLFSVPSPAVWTQFLPASSFFSDQNGKIINVVDLALQAPPDSTTNWKLIDTSAAGAPASAPQALTFDTSGGQDGRFVLRALVTQLMFDAYGRKTQESFVDISILNASGELVPSQTQGPDWTKTISINQVPNIRVRLLELQARPNATIHDAGETVDAWSARLFPQDTGVEASARIVRMSPPISIANL